MAQQAARQGDRLHGLDAVRGLAAVAVIALHASYAYALAPMPGLVWPVPVDEPSRFADACFWAVEGFVMPLFFTLSGYFLARSLSRQSPLAVAAGRTKRLLVPLLTVGIAILAADLLIWTVGFVLTGRATWNDLRRMKFGPAIDDHLWGPAHLWYLEYLWILCVGVCLAAWLWGGAVRAVGARLPARGTTGPLAGWLGVVSLVAAAAVLLGFHPEIVLDFQHHVIVPAWPKLLHAGIFLLLGAVLHRSGEVLEAARKGAPFLLAGAVGLFASFLPAARETVHRGMPEGFDGLLGGLLALYAVLATLGCVGAGLRWLDRPNPWLARLAAASFWVYMFHHPVVGGLQLALRSVEVSSAVKFAVAFGGTVGVCLLTFWWFVEGKAIGRMLDGELPWRAFRRTEAEPVPEPVPVRKAA
jgi:peptidoglycan/LPS O-acetylase OafA/YrhL